MLSKGAWLAQSVENRMVYLRVVFELLIGYRYYLKVKDLKKIFFSIFFTWLTFNWPSSTPLNVGCPLCVGAKGRGGLWSKEELWLGGQDGPQTWGRTGTELRLLGLRARLRPNLGPDPELGLESHWGWVLGSQR